MDSQKTVAEFCVIIGKFTSITLDLLPQKFQLRLSPTAVKFRNSQLMADMLHKAIQAMSLEEEAPLVLPDSPRFRVFDENSCSLLGRLLNPECQSMARMIDYMPTAWRVYGRVRGIALSRDRFQFIFQREEDLQTVLNDRPWSYNHWAMVIDRWTANPPEDYLQYMELWIRIRHIPMNLFTIDTMFALAKEIGKVEEIAYDPKVSHTKDYIRAKILFNVDNPAKAFRKLEVCKDSTATIEFEYEKIHKLCFHCRRLTHEKYRCPLLRRGAQSAKTVPQTSHVSTEAPMDTTRLDGPPGFPLLFPELSNEDRKMALLYISHADETERRARIQRVQQGIEENKAESSSRLTKITKELDKGKGHVFSYQNPASDKGPHSGSALLSSSRLYLRDKEEDDSESSASLTSACRNLCFQRGVSKAPRKRPSSWKRRAGANSGVTASVSPTVAVSNGGNAKRKPSALDLPENKSSKVSDSTRRDVWDRIVSLGLNRDEAWILAGDFNELLSNDEKSGGAIRTDSSFWDFRNMVQNCKLREVRYTGNCLSWGGWRENVWVQCRLDRSFGNSEWFSLFPKSNMEYLEMWASDHRPIRVSFALEKEDSRKGRFFFDKRMLSREGFEDLVRSSWEGRPEDRSCTMERIGRCRRRIMSWKKNADMNSRNKIIRLKAALEAEVSKSQSVSHALSAIYSIGDAKIAYVSSS
ncbi:hypothetical protein Bca52824_003263 [Brassica carinata]|uniref:DUF4283 domain-containing protein n=1 Tax=Brassica carinata TaxID=52824 RepID=A0A8X7WPY4_BRACI|nr:hypothetical protein Bca52824_003263 [Brassica carinata]